MRTQVSLRLIHLILFDSPNAVGARVPQRLVDMTARSGYSLSGAVPATRYDMAAEYYQFDWEFGATPEETYWLGCSWVQLLPSFPF